MDSGNDFSDMTSKGNQKAYNKQATKAKIDKGEYIKLKTSVHQRILSMYTYSQTQGVVYNKYVQLCQSYLNKVVKKMSQPKKKRESFKLQ